MHASKFTFQPPGQRANKTGINRGTLVIVLCGMLCLTGVVTTYAYASTSHPSPVIQTHIYDQQNHPVKTSTRAQPSPGPTHPALHQTPQAVLNPVAHAVFYGNTHLSEIALTFDDGPNPVYTSQVLAVLQAYNVKATFFDVGYLVKDFPNIVRQEFLQGNTIGNHSWSHPQLIGLSAAGVASQLASTSNAIEAVTGTRPTVFRPPYGSYNSMVLAEALRQNLSTILWNDEGQDWALPGVSVIVQRILNLAHDGGIILMHDGGGFRYQTVEALPIIIRALKQRGFTFVTIPQLLRDSTTSGTSSSSPTVTGD